jgi:hypothetical protein
MRKRGTLELTFEVCQATGHVRLVLWEDVVVVGGHICQTVRLVRDFPGWAGALHYAGSMAVRVVLVRPSFFDFGTEAVVAPCPVCGGQCGYWNLPLCCGRSPERSGKENTHRP